MVLIRDLLEDITLGSIPCTHEQVTRNQASAKQYVCLHKLSIQETANAKQGAVYEEAAKEHGNDASGNAPRSRFNPQVFSICFCII